MHAQCRQRVHTSFTPASSTAQMHLHSLSCSHTHCPLSRTPLTPAHAVPRPIPSTAAQTAEWVAWGMSNLSPFLPLYLRALPQIPARLARPLFQIDDTSMYWIVRRLQVRCLRYAI